MFKLAARLSVIALASGGCAASSHGAMRGSVVMRVSSSEAHVCMGSGEVAPGDVVQLIRHECPSTGADTLTGVEPRCVRRVIGTGEVVKVLNEHYSVVRFPAGVAFAEGDTVEKRK